MKKEIENWCLTCKKRIEKHGRCQACHKSFQWLIVSEKMPDEFLNCPERLGRILLYMQRASENLPLFERDK